MMKLSKGIKSIFSVGFLAVLTASMSTSLTGCLTSDKSDSPAKSDSTPWSAETVLMVGAQGNLSLGSAVDLDAKKVLTSAQANAAQATIDILFVFSGGDLQLASPVAAKEAGDVPLAAGYDTTKIKDTQFVRVSTKPETSQLGETTYEQSPKTNMSFVLDGSGYLVKTGEGKLVYIEISNVVGTDNTASAQFKVQLSGL